MNIVINSFSFLIINLLIFIGSCFRNTYILGAIKIINDNIIISNKSLFLQSYFYTWIIFIAYNLYLSLFHLENFLLMNNNIFYLVFSVLLHFIIMFICAIYEVGIKKLCHQYTKFQK